MKIIQNLLKDHRDEWLVKMTSQINKINPVVDRIMENDSIESVTMTNDQGAPILTNVSLNHATTFGLKLHTLGHSTMMLVKELDVFDEALVLRLQTLKYEILLAPHKDFNILVVQHSKLNKHR